MPSKELLYALSANNTWRLLTHYELGLLTAQSTILDKDFYISPLGKQNSLLELEATYQAFFDTPSTQCRFPARKMWLEKMIPNVAFPKVRCAQYQTYLQSFKADSVSVVYASGYLGNPASMFGHVLLKFNNEKTIELLDNTYSYGANVPDNDNKLEYIFKGITGGYQGHFANQKYHHQHLLYNESELRDLWEYRLTLNKFQVNFLLAHLWELENTSMTYYFFKQNCGYQLAKLLELILDKPLVAPGKIWVMPYDLIMMLNKPETMHFVEEIIYHQSRQEMLYNKYRQLSDDERELVSKIVDKSSNQTRSLLQKIGENTSKRVIDTLYDYYAFIESKYDGLTEEQNIKRDKLLTQRFNLPPEQTVWKQPNKTAPHLAQDTALFQLSTIYNESFGQGYEVRFRANYYDLLNINAARIPNSALTTFDFRLLYEQAQHQWSLREFTLFNIINLNMSQTGLSDDKFYAWSLSAGYKPKDLTCTNCSDFYVNGFLGKSMRFSNKTVGYAALAAKIQFSDLSSFSIYSGPEIGGVVNITPYWAMSLKIGTAFNLNQIAESKNYISWEQRFFDHQAFDVRTSVNYDKAFEYAINFSIYW